MFLVDWLKGIFVIVKKHLTNEKSIYNGVLRYRTRIYVWMIIV